MSSFEHSYMRLVNQVVTLGERRPSRVGDTLSLFGTTLRIPELRTGSFPVLTSRKMYVKPILGELAAFLVGAKTLKEFKDFGCNYWDGNAKAWVGNLGREPVHFGVGRIYGVQWREWNGVHDQLFELVRSIQQEPFSRRHLLTTWNPSELKLMCLPPCHLLAQFNVTSTRHLDCVVTMRSVDLCLGLPSDIVMYAALVILLAQTTNLLPGTLTFMMGDSHVYVNHEESWKLQQTMNINEHPTWELSSAASVLKFEPNMLNLSYYETGPKIAYELNV